MKTVHVMNTTPCDHTAEIQLQVIVNVCFSECAYKLIHHNHSLFSTTNIFQTQECKMKLCWLFTVCRHFGNQILCAW